MSSIPKLSKEQQFASNVCILCEEAGIFQFPAPLGHSHDNCTSAIVVLQWVQDNERAQASQTMQTFVANLCSFRSLGMDNMSHLSAAGVFRCRGAKFLLFTIIATSRCNNNWSNIYDKN